MNVQLRAARESSGKTQAQVAMDSSITVIAYQRYEYDKREPGVRTAIRVAEAVGITDFTDFKEFKALFGAAAPDSTPKE